MRDSYVQLLGMFFTAVVGQRVGYKIAQKKIKTDYYNKALQNRYYLVYCPLRNLLLETHISSATIGLFFKTKIKKALELLRKSELRKALDIFKKDHKENPLYEVEFGQDFPLEEIKKVIKNQGKWADAKLLNLIQRADRSLYETRAYSFDGKSDGLLESEKFDLADYIWDQYEKLNKRLLPR
jgi:hypothetical protein